MDDFVIEIDDELLAELEHIAAQEGCDAGELAGRLIKEALARRK